MIKRFNVYFSLFIDYVTLLLLLLIINNYVNGHWFLDFALPLCSFIFAILFLVVSIKFIKVNKYIKTSLILLLCNLAYISFTEFLNWLIGFKFPNITSNINRIFNANLSDWSSDLLISDNTSFIIVLTITAVAISFLIYGIIKQVKDEKNKDC